MAPDPTPTQRSHSTASLFDSIGKSYEVAWANIPGQQRSLAWLLAQLPHPGSKTLDIGCGTGKPAVATLAAAGHRVHGIDISTEMLATARASVPAATFEQVDVRKFQAPDGEFDAVVSYFALLVWISRDEIREVVRDVFSWLRPNGVFVFGTIPNDLEHVGVDWMGRRAVVSSMSEEGYLALLRDAGFRIEFHETERFEPKAVEAGLCSRGEAPAYEDQLFVYARKPGGKGEGIAL